MSGDRPDARELLEAVGAWLAEELAPALDGGARFQALVAVQALGIASRELELAAQHAEADREAFAPLIGGREGDPRRALCAAVRAGEHDGALQEVATVLREHVRRKLAIARPGYDAS